MLSNGVSLSFNKYTFFDTNVIIYRECLKKRKTSLEETFLRISAVLLLVICIVRSKYSLIP